MVDAAIDLIGEGGLRSMTFVAIGDRAGYSRGLVTARFGSKQGLVDAVIHRVWNRLRELRALPDTHDGSGLESMRTLVEALADHAKNEPGELRALYVMMFAAIAEDDEALADRMRVFHVAMRESITIAFEHGVADGSVRAGVDPAAESLKVTATIRGLAYQWLLEPDRVDLVDALLELSSDLESIYRPLRAERPGAS